MTARVRTCACVYVCTGPDVPLSPTFITNKSVCVYVCGDPVGGCHVQPGDGPHFSLHAHTHSAARASLVREISVVIVAECKMN